MSAKLLQNKPLCAASQLIAVDAALRKAAAVMGRLAEEWDAGHGSEGNGGEAPGGVASHEGEQESVYVSCVQTSLMPEGYLEPCVVSHQPCPDDRDFSGKAGLWGGE